MSGKPMRKPYRRSGRVNGGQYASMKAGLDSDGNNSVSQTEAQAYLDRQDFTQGTKGGPLDDHQQELEAESLYMRTPRQLAGSSIRTTYLRSMTARTPAVCGG